MEWLKAQARDDRGYSFEPLKPSAATSREDPELGAMLARVTESIWRSAGPLRLRASIPVLCVLIVAVITPLVITPLGLPPWAPGIAIPLTIIPVMMIAMRIGRRRHATRIVESLLRIGRCPSCGYRLENLAVEPDGMVVCPECAASWKKERVQFARLPARDLVPEPDSPDDARPVGRSWVRAWTRMPTIVDDRDRSVPLTDLSLGGVDPAVDPARVGSARSLLLRHSLVDRIGCAGVLGAFALFYAGMRVWGIWARGGGGLGPWALAGTVVLVPMWLIGAWRIWTGRSWVGQKAAVRILEDSEICPSCAGDLAGCAAEADGCTVCPKCFAAWKLGDYRSTRSTTSV